jgi:hypothetical protein
MVRLHLEGSTGYALEIRRSRSDDEAVNFPFIIPAADGEIGIFAGIKVTVSI